MMFFINGCSFSETQYQKDGRWKPWSDYLIDDYSKHGEIFNNAVSSNGQGKILDSTIQSIETYPFGVGKNVEFAIIQFSAVSRGYSNNYDGLIKKVIQNKNYHSLIHEHEYLLDGEDTVTNFLNEVDKKFYISSLVKILAIKNYFENKNIPYLFFWGWQQITDNLENDEIIQILLQKIYEGNWWKFGKHGGMSEWGIDKFGKKLAILPEDFHPTTLVHKTFYKEIILPIIKDRYGK